ncbi:MAG TPA: hypothetical protein VFU31_22515 [Candidatus Binatia bacterium]|nr:hypothetical protein [Candidatus Binatia bacterium]
MRNKVCTVLSVFLISMLTASLAVARDLDFELNGREISPGTTTKNCQVGTYTTTDITFAGFVTGDGRGTWIISLDAEGKLDANCEPVRCATNSPVLVTGGTWILKLLLGTASGPITGGSLAFRPDSLPDGQCLGPVQGDLSLEVDLALGRLWWVRSATMTNILLDHNFLVPRVGAELELTD